MREFRSSRSTFEHLCGASMLAAAACLLVSCQASHDSQANTASLGPSDSAFSDEDLNGTPMATLPDPVEPALDPSVAPIALQAWSEGAFRGLRLETENYQIYTTVRRTWATEQFPRFMETALEAYTTEFGELPAPRRPMQTFLFATRDQWLAKTAKVLPDRVEAFRKLGRGGYATRGMGVLFDLDDYGTRDTLTIAAHEGWHQYTQSTFKDHLPVWLEEGLATYMEGYKTQRDGGWEFEPSANRERARMLVRAAYRGRFIDFDELLNRSPQSFLRESKDDLLVYYSQVWSMARFLAEGLDGKYRAGLEQALQDAAAGTLHDNIAQAPNEIRGKSAGDSRWSAWTRHGGALIHVYFNEDIEAFEAEYDEWTKDLARSNSRRRRGYGR